jgi:DUF1365 family protein
MDLTFDFSVGIPSDTVRVVIRASDRSGQLMVASLAGKRRQLSDAQLLRVFVTHPLVTLKVVAAIHWQALRLWNKGLRLFPHPRPPDAGFSVSHPNAHGDTQ